MGVFCLKIPGLIAVEEGICLFLLIMSEHAPDFV